MMVTAMSTARLCLAAFALAVLLAACGGQEPAEPAADGGAAPVETEAAPGESAAMKEEVRPDREPLITGPRSEDGLQAILGTGDLGVGVNRVGFVLTSPDGIVTDPVTVTSSYGGGRRQGCGRDGGYGVPAVALRDAGAAHRGADVRPGGAVEAGHLSRHAGRLGQQGRAWPSK